MQVLRGLKQFYDFVATKPYIVLWGAIPCILLIIIFFEIEPKDIQLHDIYFIFEKYTLSFFFSTIGCILGLIYWMTKNLKLLKWITFFHLIFYVLNVFLFMFYRIASISPAEIWKYSFGSDLYMKLNQMV